MTLKATLYNLVQPLLGETTIWLDQSAPRPALPYVGIRITPFQAVNNDYYDAPDTNGAMVIKGDREFTLNVQRYGPDSVMVLSAFVDKLRKWSVIEGFMAAKIAVVDTALPVTDISFAKDGVKYEPRAAVDIRFRVKSQIADVVELIETVNANGDLLDANGDIVQTVDVVATLV